jgi:AraC-like DNA-binding protein
VELQGPIVDNMVGTSLTDATAVRQNALSSGLNAALDAIHNRARNAPPSFDPEMSALGLGVLAAWMGAGQQSPAQSHLTRAVIKAERHFFEHHTESINVSQLTRRLGIAYSYFRREFKARTGYSPWQYVLYLRLSRAQRLLASSDATLEDIASRVGFSSAFHLSSAFKKAFGVSPQSWRHQLRDGRPATEPTGHP